MPIPTDQPYKRTTAPILPLGGSAVNLHAGYQSSWEEGRMTWSTFLHPEPTGRAIEPADASRHHLKLVEAADTPQPLPKVPALEVLLALLEAPVMSTNVAPAFRAQPVKEWLPELAAGGRAHHAGKVGGVFEHCASDILGMCLVLYQEALFTLRATLRGSKEERRCWARSVWERSTILSWRRRHRVLPVDRDTLDMLGEYISRGGPVKKDGSRPS